MSDLYNGVRLELLRLQRGNPRDSMERAWNAALAAVGIWLDTRPAPTPPVVEEMPEDFERLIAKLREIRQHEPENLALSGSCMLWLYDALQSSQQETTTLRTTLTKAVEDRDEASRAWLSQIRVENELQAQLHDLRLQLQSSQQRAELMKPVVDAAIEWADPKNATNYSPAIELTGAVRDYRSTQRAETSTTHKNQGGKQT